MSAPSSSGCWQSKLAIKCELPLDWMPCSGESSGQLALRGLSWMYAVGARVSIPAPWDYEAVSKRLLSSTWSIEAGPIDRRVQ